MWWGAFPAIVFGDDVPDGAQAMSPQAYVPSATSTTSKVVIGGAALLLVYLLVKGK